MKPSQRIVTKLPLDSLWGSRGAIDARRVGPISTSEIAASLRISRLAFVVADVGHPLVWIEPDVCFDFWKREVKAHIAEPNVERIDLGKFPGSYAYAASQWVTPLLGPIIVLEKLH